MTPSSAYPSTLQALKLLSVSAIGFAATSCMSVPDAPDTTASLGNINTEFAHGAASTGADVETTLAEWWGGFNDPILTALVDRALQNNRSLLQSDLAIDRLELVRDIQALGTSLATSTRASVTGAQSTGANSEFDVTGQAGLSASWEIDTFNRIESLLLAAESDVQIAREDRRDLAVILAASVADAYADLRGAEVRYRVAKRNADLQAESLELLRTLFENGRSTRLDLERAESQYQTTLASLPALKSSAMTALYTIAALTGDTDATVISEIVDKDADTIRIPVLQNAMITGDPEAMIRRRPDIRSAEINITRALALGSAARAELFPTLTFNAGVNSLFVDGLDIGDSFGFSVGPALQWSGPDLRRTYLNIDASDLTANSVVNAYEQTVIDALSEVNIALTQYALEVSRRENLERAAQSAQSALELARIRFEEGLDDYLDVIDAQRTLLSNEDSLESSKLAASKRAIAAYRALGGIWTDQQLDARSTRSEETQ